MSRTSFEGIPLSLHYKDKNGVEYYNGFFFTRQMEEAWNLNMAGEFNPLWINVLGESIMDWFNKDVPGSMCIGSKPHHFGNEGTLFFS